MQEVFFILFHYDGHIQKYIMALLEPLLTSDSSSFDWIRTKDIDMCVKYHEEVMLRCGCISSMLGITWIF